MWTNFPDRLDTDRTPTSQASGCLKPAVPPACRRPGTLSVAGTTDGGTARRFVVGWKKTGPTCRIVVPSFDNLVSGTNGVAPTKEDSIMRFMLIQNYGGVELESKPMNEWTPEEIQAHIAFQIALNSELGESGEFVDAQALSGPDQAKFVLSDGASAPVVTDGPFPEGKELLAGYRIVDVDSAERAIDIAARISAAPGRGGAPIGQRIEVREVMSAPDPEL